MAAGHRYKVLSYLIGAQTMTDEQLECPNCGYLSDSSRAMRAEIERLRSALKDIAEYGYNVRNNDAWPIKEIARRALGLEQKVTEDGL
jgi:hypothetical protein